MTKPQFEHKQRLNYKAWIVEPGKTLRVCTLEEVSARGATVRTADAPALPDTFLLLPAPTAVTCRECRITERDGDRIVVEFTGTLALKREDTKVEI